MAIMTLLIPIGLAVAVVKFLLGALLYSCRDRAGDTNYNKFMRASDRAQDQASRDRILTEYGTRCRLSPSYPNGVDRSYRP